MAENDDLFADAIDADAPAESAPAESAPADAPLQPEQPQVQPRTQKPRSNVYTMMLILSLAAIVTSCVLLYLHLSANYGDYPWWDTKEVSSELAS